MVVRRRKKSRKYRGSRTHGYGRIGQHRKSGSRGGFGAAGLHKHKWTWIVKYYPDYFGKHGFTRPPELTIEVRGINVGLLDNIVEDLAVKGLVRKENDIYIVDLPKLGINKLLGSGRVTKKMKVITISATEKAIEKIREAGGEVVVLGEKRES